MAECDQYTMTLWHIQTVSIYNHWYSQHISGYYKINFFWHIKMGCTPDILENKICVTFYHSIASSRFFRTSSMVICVIYEYHNIQFFTYLFYCGGVSILWAIILKMYLITYYGCIPSCWDTVLNLGKSYQGVLHLIVCNIFYSHVAHIGLQIARYYFFQDFTK